jgi:hypothetical protein
MHAKVIGNLRSVFVICNRNVQKSLKSITLLICFGLYTDGNNKLKRSAKASVLRVLASYICFILYKRNASEMTKTKMATLPAGMVQGVKANAMDLEPNQNI